MSDELQLPPLESSEALRLELSKINISVRARGSGRGTKEVERWQAARALAALGEAGLLGFPLEVVHRDRPDFFFRMAGDEVGVEATEAVSQSGAAARVTRDRNVPGAAVDASIFKPGTEPWKRKNLIRHLKSVGRRLTGRGWAGDEVEREWVDAIAGVVAAKAKSIHEPGYDLRRRMWLLVEDNLSLPALELEKALPALCERLNRFARLPGDFERVFIGRGGRLLGVSQSGEEVLQVPALWASGGGTR